jgi:hypothetical protein
MAGPPQLGCRAVPRKCAVYGTAGRLSWFVKDTHKTRNIVVVIVIVVIQAITVPFLPPQGDGDRSQGRNEEDKCARYCRV